MDYEKIYNELINSRKILNRTRKTTLYVESHHIVPKFLGGLDNKENLVLLTAKEHLVAHVLLAKIHGGKAWLAVVRMKHKSNGETLNSSMYEFARIKAAKESSIRNMGKRTIRNLETNICEHQSVNENVPDGYAQVNLGKFHSDDVKLKISETKISQKLRHTKERRCEMTDNLIKQHASGSRKDSYKKISKSRKGQTNRRCYYTLSALNNKYIVDSYKELQLLIRELELTKKLLPSLKEEFKTFTKEMISEKPMQNKFRTRMINSIGCSVQKFYGENNEVIL